MKTNLMTNMSRSFNKVMFKVKKHSPEILIVAGVVGVVTSAVMACKATTKLPDILEDNKKKVDMVHAATEAGVVNDEPYTQEDRRNDLTKIYVKTGLDVTKLYLPSVTLGIISLSGIVASHRILTKRNVALAAAYATIDKGFKEYRGRVVERFGKELDQELRFNLKSKEIEKTVTDENGNEKTVKETVSVVDPNGYSDYAKIWDDGNAGWTKDPEQNLFFLKQQQSYANKKLQSRGYLFLNEVYEMLGFQPTKAGQIVGWVYDEKNPVGDNFVDFGLFDIDNPKVRDFINGYERCIVLDFNVDGNIHDLFI